MTDIRQPFHVTLHARPSGTWPPRTLRLDGRETTTLEIPPSRLDCPFAVSFEEAQSQLSALPRLFIEPDGAFVWVSERGAIRPWQVDGMLFDRAGKLQYVELKGHCPVAVFSQLLTVCGSPLTSFVVHLVRHAVVMEIGDFCQAKLDVYD